MGGWDSSEEVEVRFLFLFVVFATAFSLVWSIGMQDVGKRLYKGGPEKGRQKDASCQMCYRFILTASSVSQAALRELRHLKYLQERPNMAQPTPYAISISYTYWYYPQFMLLHDVFIGHS